MANEYVNKVVVGGVTKLDLTGDTVDPEHLMAGYTAHDSSGAPILGTGSGGLFFAEYGTTTFAQVTAALDAGKVVLCEYNGRIYYYSGISNGYHTFFCLMTAGSTYTYYRLYLKNSWENASVSIASTSSIPTVPTNVSSFTNDAGYLTEETLPTAVDSVNGQTGNVVLTSSDIQATGNTVQGALDSKVDLISGKANPAQISSKFFYCGSSMTLNAGHANGFLLFQSDSDCTVTVPANVLPEESEFDIYRFGAGEVYINGASGVNIFSPAGWTHKIAFQNGCVHLKQYSTNQWVMTGDVFDLLDDNQKRHIFVQSTQPTMSEGDIWIQI